MHREVNIKEGSKSPDELFFRYVAVRIHWVIAHLRETKSYPHRFVARLAKLSPEKYDIIQGLTDKLTEVPISDTSSKTKHEDPGMQVHWHKHQAPTTASSAASSAAQRLPEGPTTTKRKRSLHADPSCAIPEIFKQDPIPRPSTTPACRKLVFSISDESVAGNPRMSNESLLEEAMAAQPLPTQKGGVKAAAKAIRAEQPPQRLVCPLGPLYFGHGKVPPKTYLQFQNDAKKLVHIVTVHHTNHKAHAKIVEFIAEVLVKDHKDKAYAALLKKYALLHWPNKAKIRASADSESLARD